MIANDSYWIAVGAAAPIIGLAHVVSLESTLRDQRLSHDLFGLVGRATSWRRVEEELGRFRQWNLLAQFLGILATMFLTGVFGLVLLALGMRRDTAQLRELVGWAVFLSMAALFVVALLNGTARSAMTAARRLDAAAQHDMAAEPVD